VEAVEHGADVLQHARLALARAVADVDQDGAVVWHQAGSPVEILLAEAAADGGHVHAAQADVVRLVRAAEAEALQAVHDFVGLLDRVDALGLLRDVPHPAEDVDPEGQHAGVEGQERVVDRLAVDEAVGPPAALEQGERAEPALLLADYQRHDHVAA
jgi:hypothetical protein